MVPRFRISRRRFLEKVTLLAGAALASGLAWVGLGTLTGCGKESDIGSTGTTDPQACRSNGAAASIGSNHGHAMSNISGAEVVAASGGPYTLTGSHTHSVTLTSQNWADLQAGKSIQVASSTDFSHAHTVTISCLS